MPLTKELCHWDDDVFLENCSTTVGTAEIWRFSVAATEWWTKPNPFIPNCNFIQARFFLEFFPLCFRFIFNVRNVLCGEQSRNAQTVAAAPQLRRDKKSGLRFVRAEKTESECKRNGRTKTFAADTLGAAFTSYSIAHGTGKKRSHRKWRRLPCITVLVNFYYIFILNDVKKERWNTHTQRQCHLIAAAKKCAKTGTNRKKNWCVCVCECCARLFEFDLKQNVVEKKAGKSERKFHSASMLLYEQTPIKIDSYGILNEMRQSRQPRIDRANVNKAPSAWIRSGVLVRWQCGFLTIRRQRRQRSGKCCVFVFPFESLRHRLSIFVIACRIQYFCRNFINY